MELYLFSAYSPGDCYVSSYQFAYTRDLISWVKYIDSSIGSIMVSSKKVVGHTMMMSSNGNIFRVTSPLCAEFYRSTVNSPHKGQSREALKFSLIWTGTNGRENNPDAGDLRHHRAHYDVSVMHIGPTFELWFNIKMPSYPWSYLHCGIAYTSKMMSLYCISLLTNTGST